MTAKIIDGSKIAEQIRSEVAVEVKKLKQNGITPGLAVVLVGENPASVVYVRNKEKDCEKVGIYHETIRLPVDIKEDELLKLIDRLNKDPKFHGFLVQLPLPPQIDENKIINAISPEKDVDGFHPVNVGKLLVGKPDFMPCTPYGIQQMLIRSGYDPSGKHVVICGRSNIVGKPMAMILVQKAVGANATVTICHTKTPNLSYYTKQADILIAAAGSPKMITADMVKEGVVVIDVGTNRVADPTSEKGFKLVGDVDFEQVKEKAAAISPVPGGVGPMTRAMLLLNTLKSATRQLK